MDPTGDELAGIVDLFGGLTREELRRAVEEAAYRAGESVDDDRVGITIDDGIDGYRLVEHDTGDDELILAGPTAFPSLPDGAEDLPHIVDVDARSVDREALTRAVVERLQSETETAIEEGDTARVDRLLDVVYDVETWGAVDADDLRSRLETALDTGDTRGV